MANHPFDTFPWDVIKLTLTPQDAERVRVYVKERATRHAERGATPRHQCPEDNDPQGHFDMGEIAVGYHTGYEWLKDAEGDWYTDRPDIGPDDVKTTRPARRGKREHRLWTIPEHLGKGHPQVRDRPHVLVYHMGDLDFWLMGWAWGYEIENHGTLCNAPDRDPSLYLENHNLQSMETLCDSRPEIPGHYSLP